MKSSASKLIKTLVLVLLPLIMVVANNQALAADKITFYHYDLLGSPVATTNELGEVVWREEYSPYGDKLLKQDAGQDNVRGYTGHVFDEETGLTYMQARYYDPQIGRFMGVDPVGFVEDNPISFNRYAYGNANPYKYTDPNGEMASPDDAFWAGYDLGGVLAGLAGIGYGYATDDQAFIDAGFSMMTESALGLGETAVGAVNPAKIPGVRTVQRLGKKLSKGKKKSRAELPSLDSTGKVHGELPKPQDLDNYTREELEQLRDELKKSVQQRIEKNIEHGSHKPHGERQADEQQLVDSIDSHLDD